MSSLEFNLCPEISSPEVASNPEAIRPVALERCPVALERCPAALERCPVALERCPRCHFGWHKYAARQCEAKIPSQQAFSDSKCSGPDGTSSGALGIKQSCTDLVCRDGIFGLGGRSEENVVASGCSVPMKRASYKIQRKACAKPKKPRCAKSKPKARAARKCAKTRATKRKCAKPRAAKRAKPRAAKCAKPRAAKKCVKPKPKSKRSCPSTPRKY